MKTRKNLYRLSLSGEDLNIIDENFRKLFDWCEELENRINDMERVDEVDRIQRTPRKV